MEFALAQLFDFGIFLLVAGGVMTAVLALAQDTEDETPSDERPPNPASTEDDDAADDAEAAPSESTSEQEPAEAGRSMTSVGGGK